MSDIGQLQKYAELYAQSDAVKAIDTRFRASSILLSGEDDDGLKVLARIVAAKLVGIAVSAAFDEHTDIVVYPKPQEQKAKSGKKSTAEKQKRYAISVDDIRDIIDSLYLTPFELDKRIYIIENAESMSEILQNKLLKSLEEPPPRVCFILCASGRLLPTVESRCNRIELPPFDIETVATELAKHHADKSAVALAARASRGNFGLAESILKDAGFADMYKAAKDILKTATGSKAFAKTAAIYEKLTRERIDSALGIMEYLLSDIARYTAGVETVFDSRDVAEAANGFTPYSAALCADCVRTARKQIAANCMPSAVMDTMILKIMEEKAKCRKL